FYLNAGTIGSTSSRGVFNFGGTTIQRFVTTGILIPSYFDYYINPTSIVEIDANSAFASNSNGRLDVHGTLRLKSTNSVGSLTTNLGGNINMSTSKRFYYAGANIVYCGDAAQVVGNGHPTGAGVNLVVDNSYGLNFNDHSSIGAALAIGGN